MEKVEGDHFISSDICTRFPGSLCSSVDRQCHSCDVSKQTGGTRSKSFRSTGNGNSSVGRKAFAILVSKPKGDPEQSVDFLTRYPIREAEWSLNLEVFGNHCNLWGQLEVDLFPSKESAQVPQFFYLNNLDGSRRDALAHLWNFHLRYAFSPFQLIPLVLKNIQREGLPVILISPY